MFVLLCTSDCAYILVHTVICIRVHKTLTAVKSTASKTNVSKNKFMAFWYVAAV
jgi:hypothetical protein